MARDVEVAELARQPVSESTVRLYYIKSKAKRISYTPVYSRRIIHRRRRQTTVERYLRIHEPNNRWLAQELNEARTSLNAKEEEIKGLNYQLLAERAKLLCGRDAIINRTLEFLCLLRNESDQLREMLTMKDCNEINVGSTLKGLDDAISKRRLTGKRATTDLEVISEEDSENMDSSANQTRLNVSVKQAHFKTPCQVRRSENTETEYDVQMDATESGSSALTSTPFPKSNSSSSGKGLTSAESAASYPKRPVSSICNSAMNKPYETCIFSVGNLINSTPYRRMQQESFFMEQPLSDTAQADMLNDTNSGPVPNGACNVTFGLTNFDAGHNATPSIFQLPQDFEGFDSDQDECDKKSDKESNQLNETYDKVQSEHLCPPVSSKAKHTNGRAQTAADKHQQDNHDVDDSSDTEAVPAKSNNLKTKDKDKAKKKVPKKRGRKSNKDKANEVDENINTQQQVETERETETKANKKRTRLASKRKNDTDHFTEVIDENAEKGNKGKGVSKAKRVRKDQEAKQAPEEEKQTIRRSKRIVNKG